MAFNVNFWTFSKKARSTAQPAADQATVYSCTANGDLDLLAPVIRLKIGLDTATPPTVYNYAQIPNFSRYYFVEGWTVKDGLWEARLTVDPWASWKTEIGSYNTYVYRSSAASNGDVADALYPVKAGAHLIKTAITSPWLMNQGAVSFTTVVGVVSGDQVNYYVMGSNTLQDFLSTIFSDNYAAALLNVLNISAYPEAKIAVNPLQYITTIHKVPISPQLGSGQISAVVVGGVTVNLTHTARQIIYNGETSARHTILKANFPVHPQAATRGAWLNKKVTYRLHVPPFGIVEIPADLLWASDAVGYKVRCDVRTGDCHLDAIAVYGAEDVIISRLQGNVAVPFPITHVYNIASAPIYTYSSDSILGNLGQLAEDVQTVLGGKQSIGNEILKRGNRLSMTGSVGSSVSMLGDCYLEAVYSEYVDDDNAENGRPLCEIRTLNLIPGYIECCPDALSIPATASECNEIRSGMEEGFFYE